MITYEQSGTEGKHPLHDLTLRKVCSACQSHQHPENYVIKLKYYREVVLCHRCLQEIVNLLRKHNDIFYGLVKDGEGNGNQAVT